MDEVPVRWIANRYVVEQALEIYGDHELRIVRHDRELLLQVHISHPFTMHTSVARSDV